MKKVVAGVLLLAALVAMSVPALAFGEPMLKTQVTHVRPDIGEPMLH
ncbi:MAG: hypothetical protein KGL39_20855 [Patescibacteria group bacterium]|nr:hypothetical protein [Patescibacteria group bacterium]